jgi:hypothetical protein
LIRILPDAFNSAVFLSLQHETSQADVNIVHFNYFCFVGSDLRSGKKENAITRAAKWRRESLPIKNPADSWFSHQDPAGLFKNYYF